jgi:hypothetical protein
MGTFRPEDFLAQRIFGTGKFRHGDISAHGQFGTVAQIVVFLGLVSKFWWCVMPYHPWPGIWEGSSFSEPTWELFNMGTFRHEVFLARGIFGTGTFRHKNISAHGQFGTVALIVGFLGLVKVTYTKYSKHEPYTVAHTFDCVCSKINNSWFNPWLSFYFSSLYPAPYIELYLC